MEMLFEDGRNICHHKIRVHGYDDVWVGKYNPETHGIERGIKTYDSLCEFANCHYQEIFPQSSAIVSGWEEVYVKLRGRQVWMQAKLLATKLCRRYIV